MLTQSINKNDRAGSRDTNDLSKVSEPDKDGTEPDLEHKPPWLPVQCSFLSLSAKKSPAETPQTALTLAIHHTYILTAPS